MGNDSKLNRVRVLAGLLCVLIVGGIGVSTADALPQVIGNLITLHNVADASVPAAATQNKGGLVFGTTSTAPLVSTGAAWLNMLICTLSAGTCTLPAMNVAITGTIAASNFSGTNTGNVESFSGYAILNSNAYFAAYKPKAAGVNTAIMFVPTVAGSVTGNAILELWDDTASASIMTLTFACNVAAGTVQLATTAAHATVAGNTLVLRFNSSSTCSVALPVGNASVRID